MDEEGEEREGLRRRCQKRGVNKVCKKGCGFFLKMSGFTHIEF